MELSVTQKRKFKSAGFIILAGVVISLIYPVFADGFSELIPYVNSLFIGLFGGMIVALLELEVFDTAKRHFSFLTVFSIKTAIYFLFFFLIVPFVIGFVESVYYQKGFLEHINSDQFRSFLFEEDFIIILFYALFFISLIIFTRQMSRKLGQGTLYNFFTGRYHQPKEVERIFLFLDLRSSTSIAEKMGSLFYHQFLRDFFNDITEPIVENSGVIYRYVGDQVVVSWNYRKGLKKANCINTYFSVVNKIKALREQYLETYQLVPAFTACFHCGSVVVGEIGDVKSQIVYHGEVLYQLAEIESKCRELDQSLLISGNLIQMVPLPELYKMVRVGELNTGGSNSLDLYTLQEATDTKRVRQIG